MNKNKIAHTIIWIFILLLAVSMGSAEAGWGKKWKKIKKKARNSVEKIPQISATIQVTNIVANGVVEGATHVINNSANIIDDVIEKTGNFVIDTATGAVDVAVDAATGIPSVANPFEQSAMFFEMAKDISDAAGVSAVVDHIGSEMHAMAKAVDIPYDKINSALLNLNGQVSTISNQLGSATGYFDTQLIGSGLNALKDTLGKCLTSSGAAETCMNNFVNDVIDLLDEGFDTIAKATVRVAAGYDIDVILKSGVPAIAKPFVKSANFAMTAAMQGANGLNSIGATVLNESEAMALAVANAAGEASDFAQQVGNIVTYGATEFGNMTATTLNKYVAAPMTHAYTNYISVGLEMMQGMMGECLASAASISGGSSARAAGEACYDQFVGQYVQMYQDMRAAIRLVRKATSMSKGDMLDAFEEMAMYYEKRAGQYFLPFIQASKLPFISNSKKNKQSKSYVVDKLEDLSSFNDLIAQNSTTVDYIHARSSACAVVPLPGVCTAGNTDDDMFDFTDTSVSAAEQTTRKNFFHARNVHAFGPSYAAGRDINTVITEIANDLYTTVPSSNTSHALLPIVVSDAILLGGDGAFVQLDNGSASAILLNENLFTHDVMSDEDIDYAIRVYQEEKAHWLNYQRCTRSSSAVGCVQNADINGDPGARFTSATNASIEKSDTDDDGIIDTSTPRDFASFKVELQSLPNNDWSKTDLLTFGDGQQAYIEYAKSVAEMQSILVNNNSKFRLRGRIATDIKTNTDWTLEMKIEINYTLPKIVSVQDAGLTDDECVQYGFDINRACDQEKLLQISQIDIKIRDELAKGYEFESATTDITKISGSIGSVRDLISISLPLMREAGVSDSKYKRPYMNSRIKYGYSWGPFVAATGRLDIIKKMEQWGSPDNYSLDMSSRFPLPTDLFIAGYYDVGTSWGKKQHGKITVSLAMGAISGSLGCFLVAYINPGDAAASCVAGSQIASTAGVLGYAAATNNQLSFSTGALIGVRRKPYELPLGTAQLRAELLHSFYSTKRKGHKYFK